MRWLKLAAFLTAYTVGAIASAVRLRMSKICKILQR